MPRTQPKAIDMSGFHQGRLTVISRAKSRKSTAAFWHCQCSCGRSVVIAGGSLRKGTKSCGCLVSEHAARQGAASKTHGASRTALYKVWRGMISRCKDVRGASFHNYGGRGIHVCSRWIASFEAFKEDMGPRPHGGTVERIDNDQGYSPKNCKWASRKVQARNRRDNNMIEYNGEIRCVTEWAEIYGFDYEVFRGRIRSGWGIEKALKTPVRPTNRVISAGGRTLTVAKWTKRLDCETTTILARVGRGWSEDDAVLTPIGEPRGTR